MKFKNYANKHSKSSRIFSEEDIWNMKLATLVENEDAILAQNNEIGIPTEKELQNSKHTTWNENNGFWESNDGRSIYDNEQEGGSGNNGGSECVGSYPVSGYTRADGTVVSDYVRTCGAAHAGQDDSNNDNDNNNEKMIIMIQKHLCCTDMLRHQIWKKMRCYHPETVLIQAISSV